MRGRLAPLRLPSPGGQAARRVLSEPWRDAVWFAGEAAHETLWGTVGGAWESGERAADAVLRRLGRLKEPAPAETKAAPKRKRKRAVRRAREPREPPEPLEFEDAPRVMRDEPR